jgi:hypothetical protein
MTSTARTTTKDGHRSPGPGDACARAMRANTFLFVTIAALGAFGSACRQPPPQPPMPPPQAPQPSATSAARVGPASIEVPFPPPPARVEFVPPRPSPRALWIDGQWTWEGRWTWERGGWIEVDASAFFLPWSVYRHRDAVLRFYPASWWRREGSRLVTMAAPAFVSRAERRELP